LTIKSKNPIIKSINTPKKTWYHSLSLHLLWHIVSRTQFFFWEFFWPVGRLVTVIQVRETHGPLGQGDIRFLFCSTVKWLVRWIVGRIGNFVDTWWQPWLSLISCVWFRDIISDNQAFHGLILKPFDNQTVFLPWLSRISDLQKTSLKGLILIIKSTYQGWYHSLEKDYFFISINIYIFPPNLHPFNCTSCPPNRNPFYLSPHKFHQHSSHIFSDTISNMSIL
jgi:hypothetical protein